MPRLQLPRPRWQTPLPPGVVGSWGPDVEEYAARELGIQFDLWQRYALNRALATNADGKLVHRTYLISTGRQNGKTGGVRSVIGWALTAAVTPAWRRILGIAHDRGQARIPYEAVYEDLQPMRRRLGGRGLAVTRYLGIRSDLHGRHREYHTGSRESRNAIRGSTNDVGVFDEVRTQVNYETWAALEPTITMSPDPLILALSTAGDERSVLLRDWWERGIRIIEGDEPSGGFGMTWYAADDDDDPTDPRAWRKANPALAEGRMSEAVILESLRSNRKSPSTFRAERLNLFSDAGADELLPPGLWRDRTARQPHETMRLVLAAEAVPTWRRVTVTVALVTDVGVWVGIAAELDSARTDRSSIAPAELVDLVAATARSWRATELAFSASAAVAPHLTEWCEVSKVRAIPLTVRDIRSASQLWRSELIGGRLTHDDDPLLAQQVRVARPSGSLEGGDWYLSVRDSLGEVDAVRASAWAAWAAIAPEARVVKPQVFLGPRRTTS